VSIENMQVPAEGPRPICQKVKKGLGMVAHLEYDHNKSRKEIQQILKDYPHVKRENAGPVKTCPGCQQKVDRDEMMACDDCNKLICADCVVQKDGDVLCKTCAKADRKNAAYHTKENGTAKGAAKYGGSK